jgi:hypothetical protein
MATKTVVCPDCGAAAAGRYACAACGSLLASVGFATRPSIVEPPSDRALEAEPETPARSGPDTPGSTTATAVAAPVSEAPKKSRRRGPGSRTKTPSTAPVPAPEPEPAWPTGPIPPVIGRGLPGRQRPADGEPAMDEPSDAPSGSEDESVLDPVATAPIAPFSAVDVSSSVTEPATPPASIGSTPTIGEQPVAPTVATAAPATRVAQGKVRWQVDADRWDAELEDNDLHATTTPPVPADPAPAGRSAAAALWPPLDDPGPAPQPIMRTPAGAYLAPSAVLPPLDGPAIARGTMGTTAVAATAQTDTPSQAASMAEAIARIDLTAEMPRRLIAIGATIAVLGFLLPWARVLAGSGLLGDYWTQWGLAGPGHWIVVGLLVLLAGVSGMTGRPASMPVGLPAIALATLLVGLVWPYLFGVLGRSVGVWLVLAGAGMMAVGGGLDRRRHSDGDPAV